MTFGALACEAWAPSIARGWKSEGASVFACLNRSESGLGSSKSSIIKHNQANLPGSKGVGWLRRLFWERKDSGEAWVVKDQDTGKNAKKSCLVLFRHVSP